MSLPERGNRKPAAVVLHDILDTAASIRPGHIAVRDRAGAATYGELARLVAAATHWLVKQGVARGDRVMMRAIPDRRTVAVLYACSRVGAAFVPVNTTMKPYQLAQVLADVKPAIHVSDDVGDRIPVGAGPVAFHMIADVWPMIEEYAGHSDLGAAAPTPAPTQPSDTALLVLTSGSTAQPKAVVCSHAQVLFAAQAVAACLDYRHSDVVFCRVPLSFDYGLYQIFLCGLREAQLVLAPPGRDAALLRDIRECGATVVPLVPSLATMLLALAHRDSAPAPVRLFTNTGEHLPKKDVHNLRARFAGAGIQLMFGTTECKRITIMPVDGDLIRPGSVGVPLPGTKVRILGEDGRDLPPGKVGEIAVCGPHLMSGYWEAPELTAATYKLDPLSGERVLHTGDYGRMDADGYLYFQGRRDNLFKRRGVRTSSLEIEKAALALPVVAAAVVLPPTVDRDATLCVVADAAEGEVLRGLSELLEPAKVPARCHIFASFPLGSNGKVDREQVRAAIEEA